MSRTNNAGFEPLNLNDLSVIALSILVFLCLFFAGRAISGPKPMQPIQVFIGLFTVYSFFIIGSVFLEGFSVLNTLIFLILLSAIGLWRSKSSFKQDFLTLGFSILFVSPLLWLAVVMNNPQWDDYSHWLPSAQFLLKYGHLPTLQEPVINHATPSYSYSRALLHTFVNLGMGTFVMNVQGVFNILFASSLLLWAKPILEIKPKKNDDKPIIILSIMGVLSSLLIIWTLTLNTRLIISSYGDPIYAICLIHLFLYLYITRLYKNSFSNGKFDWILACLFALPLIIKDVGFYHSIIIFISYWIVFEVPNFLSPISNFKIRLKVLLIQSLHFLPLILIKYIWSFYVNMHGIHKVFGTTAIDQSKIDLIPQILNAAGVQILGRPYVLLAICIMIFILRFSKPLKDQSLSSASHIFPFALIASIGIILFQLLAYLFAFGSYEAARAASFSRYIAPAGLITWASIIIVLIINRCLSNFKILMFLGSIFSTFFFIALFLNADKINLASNVNPRLKGIAEKIIQTYPKNEPLMIIDLGTNGIHSTIIRFYTNSHMPISYRASVHVEEPLNDDVITDWLKDYEHIYIHSGSPHQISLIEQYLVSRRTNLGE